MRRDRRWTLLEHLYALNDPLGKHFDLMLEDKLNCRSWRLSEIPMLDGPSVTIIATPSHNLEWLDREYAVLSEGRGIVTRLESGTFIGELPNLEDEYLKIQLNGKTMTGEIEIINSFCRLISIK